MELSEQVRLQGFAIIPAVLDCAALQVIGRDMGKSSRSRAGMRHAMRFAATRTLAASDALLHIACDALGRTAIPFRATLFDKSPASNWLVVWHQDTALPLRTRKDAVGWGPWSVKDGITYAHAPREALERVVALRIHMDDSTAENGPLRVLPGSHRKGLLTDEQIEREVDSGEPAVCVCAAGSVLVMKPLIVHASSKSHSAQPRRVLHIEYADSLAMSDGLELTIA